MFRSIIPLHCLHPLDVTQASIRWQLNKRDEHGQPSYFHTVDLILSDVLTTAAKLPLKEPQLQLIQGDSKLEIARTRASAFLTSVTNKQFLPIDMSVDQSLPQRILAALQRSGIKIDGIKTTIDVYFDTAAKVAIELSLPTSPRESLAMAQDKYATRTRFGNSTLLTLLVTDTDDLRKQLGTLSSPITYPLIIKPSKGWSSEGVFKVISESELFTSFSQLNTFQPSVKVIVETYVDGPEFDANFLLWDAKWSTISLAAPTCRAPPCQSLISKNSRCSTHPISSLLKKRC